MHVNIPDVAEDVDNDRNGKRCLGSGNTYCKEGEKESLQCLGKKVTVEHHKVMSAALSINSSEMSIASIFLRVTNP